MFILVAAASIGVGWMILMKGDAPRRFQPLRGGFDTVRWIAKAACLWRLLPGDFLPWQVVEPQSKRWIKAGVFEAKVHDLHMIFRLLHERAEQPTAAVLDGHTLQSSPESGARAGDDIYKREKGSKVHIAVDTLGHLLALVVTSANEQERAQVAALAQLIQEATERNVELAYVDQGYTGQPAAEAATVHGIHLVTLRQVHPGSTRPARRLSTVVSRRRDAQPSTGDWPRVG